MYHTSSVLFISISSALLVAIGCNGSPEDEFARQHQGGDDQTTTQPAGGSGGEAGSPATGGSVGEAGSGGDVGGSAATGGSGGTTPDYFSCAQVEDGHLVLIVENDAPPPDKFFGADGYIFPPPESGWSGHPESGWGELFVTPDVGVGNIIFNVGLELGSDTGIVPNGTQMIFAPGFSLDGVADESGLLVDPGYHACQASTCSINLLCCYGTVDVGITFPTDESGNTNPVCRGPVAG
ncbi:MAG: hypothetical protein V1745_00430 [Patescibacteria group bacterium]